MIKITVAFFLTCFVLANANLYGLWQTGNTANFGEIATNGQPSMKLEFPNYYNWHPGNSAMNNLTSIMTFILSYQNGNQFLVSVNVAKNKVNNFVPIPTTVKPYGLKYDADVNSLKCVLSSDNNTWLVGEMDPNSASYDVYGSVQGAFLGAGLSTYNHTYYVITSTTDETTMNSFDTRSGQYLGAIPLVLPSTVIAGPYDLLWISSLDILVGTVVIQDSNGNSGQDYAYVDPVSGVVKPFGIYTAQQQVTVVSHAAHQNLIYAAANFNANLQFVTIDIQKASQVATASEPTFLVSLGYFTNI